MIAITQRWPLDEATQNRPFIGYRSAGVDLSKPLSSMIGTENVWYSMELKATAVASPQ